MKDPFDLSPDFLVRRGFKLQRWQDDCINNHKTVNLSAFVREQINQLIKEIDPECYEKHKHLISNDIRRKETTPTLKRKSVLVHTSM